MKRDGPRYRTSLAFYDYTNCGCKDCHDRWGASRSELECGIVSMSGFWEETKRQHLRNRWSLAWSMEYPIYFSANIREMLVDGRWTC